MLSTERTVKIPLDDVVPSGSDPPDGRCPALALAPTNKGTLVVSVEKRGNLDDGVVKETVKTWEVSSFQFCQKPDRAPSQVAVRVFKAMMHAARLLGSKEVTAPSSRRPAGDEEGARPWPPLTRHAPPDPGRPRPPRGGRRRGRRPARRVLRRRGARPS